MSIAAAAAIMSRSRTSSRHGSGSHGPNEYVDIRHVGGRERFVLVETYEPSYRYGEDDPHGSVKDANFWKTLTRKGARVSALRQSWNENKPFISVYYVWASGIPQDDEYEMSERAFKAWQDEKRRAELLKE